MPDFNKRDYSQEIMDDLTCEGEVVARTLDEISVINARLGGNNISLSGLKELVGISNGEVLKVADLGCGGGEMLRMFNDWGLRQKVHLELTGIDANPFIIEYARKNLRGIQSIAFKTQNVLSREFSLQKFDILHCSLFLHHFTNEELIYLLRNFRRQARIGVIVNDLHRHWLAYYSIKILTRLFSKSSMVRYDAPLSVARSFKKKELEEILLNAGIEDYSLKWRWAFRWQLIINNLK